jgi:hypothetical protein
MQVGVCYFPDRILKMVHRIFERFPAAVVIRCFAKRVFAKHGRHMVKQSAYEHRRRKETPLAVGC